jgi:Family of unknown function (DUF5681)
MSTSRTRRNGTSGRKPPPEKTRFKKGQSGNPSGRPKGAVSVTGITRRFALKQEPVTRNGKPQRFTRLEIAVLKLTALAAVGSAAASEELHKVRCQLAPSEADYQAGVLLVPAELSME